MEDFDENDFDFLDEESLKDFLSKQPEEEETVSCNIDDEECLSCGS